MSIDTGDGEEKSVESRALARAPRRPERIAHIEEMMREGTWVRGKSGPVLAAIWGLCDTTVGLDAAEASRRVRATVDVEGERMKALADLDEAKEMARGAAAAADPVEGGLTVVKAAEALIKGARARADIVGAGSPKVSVHVGQRAGGVGEKKVPGWMVDAEGEEVGGDGE